MDFYHISKNRYRRFGTPYQFKVHSKEEIINNISRYNGERDIYLSISEFEDIEEFTLIIPLFVALDFDADNLEDAKKEMEIVVEWCDNNNLEYEVHDSGRKGYHIIISLFTTIPADNICFRGFYNFLIKEFDLKTLDSKCFEVMRIIRVPNTINIKSGKECKIIKFNVGNKLNLQEYRNYCYSPESEYTTFFENQTDNFKFPFPYYSPCIDNLINASDVSHEVRWIWVKIMQGRGFDSDEIYNMAKEMKWSDFNASYTRYQINYTMKKTVSISCDFLDKLGICDKSKCPLRKKS